MTEQITRVKITIGFGKSKITNTPKTYKVGEGKNLFEAIRNLFDREYNYITQDQMNEVRREILKTKERMFKRKG